MKKLLILFIIPLYSLTQISDCGEKPNVTVSKWFPHSKKNQDNSKKLKIWRDCFEKNFISDFYSYLDTANLDLVEGVYEGIANTYKTIGVKKTNKFQYDVFYLEKSKFVDIGDLVMTLEQASVTNSFFVKYFLNNESFKKRFGVYENGILKIRDDGTFAKVYPKIDSKNKRVKSGEWTGNGSGIIISKSGYIITCHHVIDDADDIEIEFIFDDEVQNFNAEIVQSDKVNDLALIKITDVNFDGFKELNYNFKARNVDVGTKVYAFGYPMALSVMGKEIKVTDGIISSKTGFDGNITTYQISAPIQGGNSGGPLFDDKGNLIGINSAGIRSDIADNVAYSIKTSYALNLIDILNNSIVLPSNTNLATLPLNEQIKEISKYVVLVKVK